MTRWNKQEIATGLVFAAIGGAAAAIATAYSFGTITRMGPGFVPICLGILLVVLGAGAAWQGRYLPSVGLDIAPRPSLYVLAGILAWVLFVDRLGFVPATLALVVTAARAERDITFLQSLVLAVALTAGGYLVFITGLGIPISAFGN